MEELRNPGIAPARRLAILGGTPAFAEPLHVGRPNIGDKGQFMARVSDILDLRWLTNNGPVVREFEQRIADHVGVKHCVAMCNATVALEIAYKAVGFAGEVILPSYTFVATAHALQWQGITPVFADIDPATHNIDPAAVERLITPRTTGIVGVHVWGRACDTEALADIAARHGLTVVYDAAHAFGCSHRGRMIGNFGACEVFSFHATKFVNSFEGGAVVTNDDALAERMRLMRNFGFMGLDRVEHLGMNGKMPEVCAAMGLTSLDAMDGIVAANRRNAETYRKAFQDLPGIDLCQFSEIERHNHQYVVAEVDGDTCPLTRDELIAVLHADNVRARRYFWPGCHGMEPYRTLQPDAGAGLPCTQRVSERVLVLPTGQSIDSQTVQTVVNIIRSATECADEVRAALTQAASGGVSP